VIGVFYFDFGIMTELIITCVIKNAQGNILQVGINGDIFDVKTIAEKIWSRENMYFTIANGIRVRVFALRDPSTNEPYLTTTTNLKLPNNLKYLPKCQ
jgi:hypothetical protein